MAPWRILALEALLGVTVGARRADAQEHVTVEPGAPGSALAVQSGVEHVERTSDGTTFYLLDVAGRLVARSGVGGYVHVPLTADADSTDVGGELGVLYAAHGPRASLVVHAGLVLPVIDRDHYDAARLLVDASRAPGTWIRFGVSPRWSVGRSFFQLDLEADNPRPQSDPYYAFGSIERIAFGYGHRGSRFDVAVVLSAAAYHFGMHYVSDHVLRGAIAVDLAWRGTLHPGLAFVVAKNWVSDFADWSNPRRQDVLALMAHFDWDR